MTKTARKSIADLNPEVKADKGHEFEIMADGDPTGMFLTVVGKESTVWKAMVRKQANDARRREFERLRKGKPEEPTTVEQDIDASIPLYASCVIGWRNVEIEAGEGEAPFTPENVDRLLRYDFVRVQVEREILGLADFTRG